MITIKKAAAPDAEVLALLGRVTYVESHGHFIEDKNDLAKYIEQAFSITKTSADLKNADHHFYLIYANDLPAGYAKLVSNSSHEEVSSESSGQLERIYVLDDFIPQKLGQKLLSLVEKETQQMGLDTLWLSVYIKNHRAIKFYKKNKFEKAGTLNFLVNGKQYENIVFSKKL